jgi:hypothetical protein
LLIILEGPDCAGKSSLAARLADYLDRSGSRYRTTESSVRVVHKGPPTEHPLREYAEPLLNYRTARQQHIICDRWHVGESVYPAIVGRPTQLDPAVNAWLELFLLSRGALLIHVRQSDTYLRDCGRHRGDPTRELERIASTTTRFDAVVAQTLLPTLSLDYGNVSDDDVADVIYQAQLLEARASQAQLATTFIGAARPSLLLVGDRRGVSGDPREHGDWPAFAPFPSTSGHWLLRALTTHPPNVREHGHALSTLALVNANDVDDVETVWRAVYQPRVVALGGHASDRLLDLKIPHSNSHHPQWWRRFRHHDAADFVTELLHREATIDA